MSDNPIQSTDSSPMAYAPPKQQGIFSRILTSLAATILVASLVLNFYLIFILYAQVRGPSEVEYSKGDADQRIVILPINGLVDDDMQKFIRDSLKELKKNPPKAIILRVNSGGGYVGASDRIWHELTKFKEQASKEQNDIPIVASFASTAASGAYYIAAVSDVIVIEPTGLTGSIGVVAQAFTVSGLMNQLGVTPETITSTDSVDKDQLNPFRDWNEKDRQLLTDILDNAYTQFVDVVYEGRKKITYDGKTYGLERTEVEKLATGAVYTAKQAKENRLVDEIGYLEKAIEIAKSKANIAAATDPLVAEMKRPAGLSLSALLRGHAPEITTPTAEQLRGWLLELSTPKLVY